MYIFINFYGGKEEERKRKRERKRERERERKREYNTSGHTTYILMIFFFFYEDYHIRLRADKKNYTLTTSSIT